MAVYQKHHYSMIGESTITKPIEEREQSCALGPGIEHGKYNSAVSITTVFCVILDEFL